MKFYECEICGNIFEKINGVKGHIRMSGKHGDEEHREMWESGETGFRIVEKDMGLEPSSELEEGVRGPETPEDGGSSEIKEKSSNWVELEEINVDNLSSKQIKALAVAAKKGYKEVNPEKGEVRR